jgi:methionine biosynthesis protein MetW
MYLVERRRVEAKGLDASEAAVAYCRGRGLDVDLADLNRPVVEFLSAHYDHVILSEVLEHLHDPERLLRELRSFVRESLLISIPNTGYIEHRLRLLMGRFPLQWLVTPGEHLRFWTHRDFLWWAKELGFEIRRYIPYEGIPWARSIWPNLCASSIVYELRGRPPSG